jgi:hypothetical protein
MDKNDDIAPGNDPPVSRAHVEEILQRAGLDEERIATLLDGIEFPSPISKIIPKFLQHGVSYSLLTDRLGGSP